MLPRYYFLLAALLACSPTVASAHARLRAAEPPVGGSVTGSPSQVEITFSEALEPRFSSIVVSDAAGKEVDRKDLHVLGGDARHVAVSLATLPPGTYHVVWHATSVDTHKTEGSYSFTVAP